MFRCLDCKAAFDEPLHLTETHGLDNPPFEDRYVCQRCHSTNYKPFIKDEVSRRECIQKLLEVKWKLNEFRFCVEDTFNSCALTGTTFDYGTSDLHDVLLWLGGDEEFDLPSSIDDKIADMRFDKDVDAVYTALTANIEED